MSGLIFHDDAPFLLDPFDDGEDISPEQKKKRIIFTGGLMGAAGHPGPAYPVMLAPLEEEEEEDPNP